MPLAQVKYGAAFSVMPQMAPSAKMPGQLVRSIWGVPDISGTRVLPRFMLIAGIPGRVLFRTPLRLSPLSALPDKRCFWPRLVLIITSGDDFALSLRDGRLLYAL